jgi:hypothetical protein
MRVYIWSARINAKYLSPMVSTPYFINRAEWQRIAALDGSMDAALAFGGGCVIGSCFVRSNPFVLLIAFKQCTRSSYYSASLKV